VSRFDGTRVNARIYAAPVPGDSDGVWACVVCGHTGNLPGPTQAEEIERLLAILETIPNAIITMDSDGRIETFNLASEPMFQFTAEEVIGENIGLLIPDLLPQNSDEASAARAQVFHGSGAEWTAQRKDGSQFPVELAVGEMNLSGRRLLACVVKDITSRVQAEKAAKEAQDQLIQAEKLASLGGLVAGVAHEINTPVGIAVTASSHLRERYLELKTDYDAGSLKRSTLEQFLEVSDQATRILETNLRRASELIQSFKQIAVDQSAAQPRELLLRQYLDEVLLSLRPRLKKVAHRVHLECPADVRVFTEPGSIAQVLTNLVMNSLAHAYEPGEAGTIRIRVDTEEHGIRLVYSDDGMGIAEEALKNIFDPFFTTKRGRGGSGLGLHIVYNIVTNSLSGTIRCTSEPGRGTSFEIRIPCLRVSR